MGIPAAFNAAFAYVLVAEVQIAQRGLGNFEAGKSL